MEAKDWKGLPDDMEIVNGVLRDKQPPDAERAMGCGNPEHAAWCGEAGACPAAPGITPGPWRVVRSSEYTDDPSDTKILSIQGADGTTVYYTDAGYFEPIDADARAIAEVPAMLALLPHTIALMEGATPDVNERADWHETIAALRALLARVEGR